MKAEALSVVDTNLRHFINGHPLFKESKNFPVFFICANSGTLDLPRLMFLLCLFQMNNLWFRTDSRHVNHFLCLTKNTSSQEMNQYHLFAKLVSPSRL